MKKVVRGAKGTDENTPPCIKSAPYFNFKGANQALNMVLFFNALVLMLLNKFLKIFFENIDLKKLFFCSNVLCLF